MVTKKLACQQSLLIVRVVPFFFKGLAEER